MQNEKHLAVMRQFSPYAVSPLIFKGGSCLLFCYGLDRFSEDLDFDTADKTYNLVPIVDSFCKKFGYKYRVAKSTETTQRCMINYGTNKPLKIEVSLRGVQSTDIVQYNGIQIYGINSLALMKAITIGTRSKCRDIYDLNFIIHNHRSSISSSNMLIIIGALQGFTADELAWRFNNSKVDDQILSNYDGTRTDLVLSV